LLFDCELGVQHLLEEHIKENHKEEDDLRVDHCDTNIRKKLTHVMTVEDSISKLLRDDTKNDVSIMGKKPKNDLINWNSMELENNAKLQENCEFSMAENL
jgi:hypothetical protein